MKVLFVSPISLSSIRGNTIDIKRIMKSVEGEDVDVSFHQVSELTHDLIEEINPDVFHAFHAYK